MRSTAATSRRRRSARASERRSQLTDQQTTNPASPGGGAEDAAGGDSEFAICLATFYDDLAERLANSAIEAFDEGGVTAASVHTFEVPGAFELPLAASWCAESGRFAGIACIGAVIRGETSHYDHICDSSARGIMEVQLRTGVPCAFGVLTCETMEQALARASGGGRDQGRRAAEAVIRMARLKEQVAGGG